MSVIIKLTKKSKGKKGGVEYTFKGTNDDGPVVLTMVVPREGDTMQIDDSRTITISNEIIKYVLGTLDNFLDEEEEEEE